MSPFRSTPAFFDDPEVHRLIERIGAQKSLVIYTGAGVSIDRTGLSWSDLINNLLKRHKDNAVRRAIMSTNTPLQAASIVSQLYVDRSDEWQSEIANDIRALLYQGRVWQAGELTRAVARLAAALTDSGKDYYVVTTNYDEFLQKEIGLLDTSRQKQGKSRIEPATSVIAHDNNGTSPAFDIAPHIRPRQVLHLHGYVSKSGSDIASIVLSEHDYILANRLSSEVLTSLFQENAVLIIGSSFTDPPLLDALARTRDKAAEAGASGGLLRVAVMPFQSMKFHTEPTPETVREVKSSIEKRMKLFGVEAVFPDFFCQVPQLLTEVQVCLDQCGPRRPYISTSSGVRYGLRLSSWWESWSDTRGIKVANAEKICDHQSIDHDKLRETLDTIRGILASHRDEKMKLEIWVRWRPDDRRELRLWASSTSTWRDVELMRRVDISDNSKYASVKAFCLGRPEIYPTEADEDTNNSDQCDRWLTYLCVPIRVGEESGELSVGVISLASMTEKANSRISENNGAAIKTAIVEMKRVAIDITAPSQSSTL